MTLALFWLATYLQVFMMGFQSRNVNTGRYGWAAGTSLMIGTAQLLSVRGIIANDPVTIWCLTATAGPCAIVSAMLFSRRVIERHR